MNGAFAILTSVFLILAGLASPYASAQVPSPPRTANSFKQCSAVSAPRSETDHFCPRMEGIHLEGCCPQLFKSPPLHCPYHVVVRRGQPFLRDSSYVTCEGGVDVSHPCCVLDQRDCSKDKVSLNFYPRLIHRTSCCFENCPSGDYWMRPPANPSITSQHESGVGAPTCDPQPALECSVGTAESCQASTPCPPPPAPPAGTPGPPAETPTPGPIPPPPPGDGDGGGGDGGGDGGGSNPGPVTDPAPPVIPNPPPPPVDVST